MYSLDPPVQTLVNLHRIVRDHLSIQNRNADIVHTPEAEVEIEIRKITKVAEAIRVIEKNVAIVLVHVDRILLIVAKGK